VLICLASNSALPTNKKLVAGTMTVDVRVEEVVAEDEIPTPSLYRRRQHKL
jgi:hypothetical protein